MDAPHVSEVLPALYRAVLDAVAALEARGRRRDAAEIRADATRVYSRAWNTKAAKRLEHLRLRADRILEAPQPTRVPHVAESFARSTDLEHTTA